LKTAKQNTSVTKILNRSVIFIAIAALLISGIGCAEKTATPAAATQVATVRLGNLTVSTSVDGNLVMPQAYNLLFGAPGNVQDVFVQEGDFVKEGTVLATLDNTSQRLSVESSNNNVQTVLSKLYENVPLLPQFPIFTNTSGTHTEPWLDRNGNPVLSGSWTPTDPNFPPVPATVQVPNSTEPIYIQADTKTSYAYYYPNATILSAYSWAQDEVNRAQQLYRSDNYTAAASELYVAMSDLDACTQILEDTINNPKSGLGNMAPFVSDNETEIMLLEINTDQSFAVSYIVQLRQAVDLIKQGQADIQSARDLIARGKYDEARRMFDSLLKRVSDIGKVVYNNYNIIKSHNYTTVYGEDISLSFYGAAADKLNAALKGIESGGLSAPELNDNLLIAEHYMRICNSILGSNDYVLQHGLSLKNEQQAHVDLQNALTGLGNSQQDFLKTVILAPFDGTVVSVGVKKNDVLSQIDYASVTAVQLVDTTQLKFQGKVDEIDILKIKTGQKATIEVDAIPHKVFAGTVSFISPFGTPDTNGVVQFPVTIQLDPSEVALKGGLTATADIAISSAENALLVPRTAITSTSAGSFVMVVDEAAGKQEKRQVTLGNQNLEFAEVLSGLKEGDKVVIQENVTGAPIVKGFPRQTGGTPPPSSR
jgi:multidrug efflux pump subunit AcrA (membrane-fusion protein)